jgi:predicted RNase H-like nuclease (RuvC/YqgF family)
LIILGVIGLGLYYGLPLLYQRYVVPLEQNTAGVTELQSRQEQTEQQLADLQAKLETIESGQSQNAETLTELDQRLSEIETEINARTQSLAALEEIQSELQAQDEAISAELDYQVNLLKAMELLSRARLLMFQSNFGLARQDVEMARDVLAKAQPNAPESVADDLDEVIRRLDLTLFNLPDFPVAARDDLDIAWQILLSGLPQIPPSGGGTPTPAGTLSATPNVTLTPTPRGTVEPSATP